jgi:DNA-binding response OmpR family regulator
MNLLLLTEAAGLQERLRRAFVAQQHRLTSVADLPAALERLSTTPYDALLIDWSLSRDSAAAAIENVRRGPRGERLFVLAMIEREQTGSIQSVFRTGVDDFVIKPCMLEELTARLESPRAVRRTGEHPLPARESRPRPTPAQGLPSPSVDGGVLQSVSALAKNELQALSGLPFQVAPWRMPPRPAFVGRVSLSLAPQPSALALSVAVEAAPLRWLGARLLGEADMRRSSLENLVCEMANTFAGSLKRAALQTGVRFHVGLPTVVPLHAFSSRLDDTGASGPASGPPQVMFTLRSDDARFALSIVAAMVPVRHVSLPLGRLHEGCVLAEDLEGGALSAPVAAGTCLTGATVERLTRALDRSTVVRVEERFDSLLRAD